ncbi:MAG: PP2C family protein-serine/threonine phosphatase [Longimicrobiales bacterium]
MTLLEKTKAASATERKPLDEEIDVFGLTHVGKVRANNQDHFLICSLRKRMDVHLSSLPDLGSFPLDTQRIAFLAMVADGVGGRAQGEEAARLAVEAITQYVAHSMHCYYTADPSDDRAFSRALEEAALQCHARLAREAESDPRRRGMATTLTLVLGVWPRLYLLQVGDSRYYLMRDAVLTQISRDQTMAQELIDQGVITRTDAYNSRWANVLSSAIGGPQTSPVVTAIDNTWDSVHLLCSDGLTRHVSDQRIGERLRTMVSARQACEALLQDALDAGGTDNITILVGRVVRRDGANID